MAQPHILRVPLARQAASRASREHTSALLLRKAWALALRRGHAVESSRVDLLSCHLVASRALRLARLRGIKGAARVGMHHLSPGHARGALTRCAESSACRHVAKEKRDSTVTNSSDVTLIDEGQRAKRARASSSLRCSATHAASSRVGTLPRFQYWAARIRVSYASVSPPAPEARSSFQAWRRWRLVEKKGTQPSPSVPGLLSAALSAVAISLALRRQISTRNFFRRPRLHFWNYAEATSSSLVLLRSTRVKSRSLTKCIEVMQLRNAVDRCSFQPRTGPVALGILLFGNDARPGSLWRQLNIS